MVQFWNTVAGRHFIEGTMPKIEQHLERIAAALENMALEKAKTDDWPTCEWCSHRHLRPSYCQTPVFGGGGISSNCECDRGE